MTYAVCKFGAYLGPSWSHGRGQVVHFNAGGVDADLHDQFFQIVDAFSGVGISFQEMTLTLQSPGHENAVKPPFQGAQHIIVVQLAGTGQTDDFDVGRVG